MIKITNHADCCGCTACASICNHNAITMEPDTLGFLYPKADVTKCVDCGLCDKVCAFNDNYDISLNLPEPIAYGARHKDANEVATSRSGAAFIALSDYILDNGGVVYGAGYKEHFRVCHKRALTKAERDEFKGSKYVQSDLTGIFHQVKEDLRNGLTVMFSGTPCQTAGLNSYIGKKLRKDLYLVDIVCHGVPSPYFWSDYINYIEKKYHKKIKEVNFRDKSIFGWKAHEESYVFCDGTSMTSGLYTRTYFKHLMSRSACSVCHYSNTTRPSDITIGDFWGWEKTAPDFNKDDKGVSLVLCNTAKGLKLFDNIKSNLIYFSAKITDCLQPNLINPSELNPQSDVFESEYRRKGFKYVLYKYNGLGLFRRIKRKIGRLLKTSH